VTGRGPHEVDPVTSTPFHISQTDRVATAGSCFAQHVSRTLVQEGFRYLVTEEKPATAAAADENFGVFPARFGNVYTPRQLLQLFDRAYGLFAPVDIAWRKADGRFLDPFRPRIQKDGYASLSDLREDRAAHLAAVRRMFEESDVFVFTLGLTEGWLSAVDGAVFPLAPGVVGAIGDPTAYSFHNFSVPSMIDDLSQVIDKARVLNKDLKFILTVSPIPLIATYEDRHVLVATTYSKSALRVVADTVCNGRVNVSYFPSYEMITGPQARSQFFADDLREVTAEGVNQVMSVFRAHYFAKKGGQAALDAGRPAVPPEANEREIAENARLRELIATVCDEIAIEPASDPSGPPSG